MTPAYLGVCAIVQDQEPYLEEWFLYHRAIGVEYFLIYENESKDQTAELARDLGAEVIEWPGRDMQQLLAHYHSLREHRDRAHWLAYIDPDEYIFCPGRDFHEFLAEQDRLGTKALGINWACFGTSGHKEMQASTTRCFVHRARRNFVVGGWEINRHIKSIIQPSQVSPHHPHDPHHFLHVTTRDVHGNQIMGPFSPSPVWDVVRLNHYIARSEAEAYVKITTPRVNNRELYGFDLRQEGFNAVYDDSMVSHLAELGLGARA